MLKSGGDGKNPEVSYLLGVSLARTGDPEGAREALKRTVVTGGTQRMTVAGKPLLLRGLAAADLAFLLAEEGRSEEIVRLQEALRDQRSTRLPVRDGEGVPRGENRLLVLLRLAEAQALAREGRTEELKERLGALEMEKGPVPWKGQVVPLQDALRELPAQPPVE